MITKIGNALLEKDAFLGAIASGAGKIAKGAWSGLRGLGQLAEGAVQGAAKGVAPKISYVAGKSPTGGNITQKVVSTPMQRIQGGWSGAKNQMNTVWGDMSKAQKAWTAGMGGVGMGMLAGGDASAPAPQYNFYQSGYPQQFSGSWQ